MPAHRRTPPGSRAADISRRRPAPRRTLAALAAVILILGICIPAVSAEEYNFVLDDSSYNEQISLPSGGYPSLSGSHNYLWILNAQEIYGNELVSVISQTKRHMVDNYNDLPHSAWTRVTIGDFMTADYGYFKFTAGTEEYLQCYLSNIEYINDYPEGLSGSQSFEMVPEDTNLVFPRTSGPYRTSLTGDYSLQFGFGIGNPNGPFLDGTKFHSIFSHKWTQNLTINTSKYDRVTLERNGLASIIYIETPNYNFTNNPPNNDDFSVTLVPHTDRPYLVSVKNPVTSKYFNYTVNINGEIGGTEPVEPGESVDITVYVKNSQTGALLADSHIVISANVNGEFHEVVNETLPAGTKTYYLQPTGGGLPNPDYYRLIATADGYNPYMPYIDFELDRPTNLIVMMEPITGGPVDENKTFIEFYVRDLAGNGISDASVTCGGYTLITNSAGYTQFEMPKNAIYPYTVRKSGYVAIEGTATVGAGPRYTVNVVLGPKEIPTYTPDPGETPSGPGATPTPDRRTNEEKGQAVIDMIADNAEGIGALALICLLMGLLKLMAKW